MDESINVKEIMRTITGEDEISVCAEKQVLASDEYIITMQDFLQINRENRKKHSIEYLLGHWNVAYYREIHNPGFVKFIKKVIRKLIKFCMFPVVEEQNAINANVLQILNAQNEEIALLKKEFEMLKEHDGGRN